MAMEMIYFYFVVFTIRPVCTAKLEKGEPFLGALTTDSFIEEEGDQGLMEIWQSQDHSHKVQKADFYTCVPQVNMF